MRQKFFHFLHFTRKERNGTLTLIVLCALVFATPEINRRLRPAHLTDFSRFQQEIEAFRDSISSLKSAGGQALFFFNPNTATFEDFVELGLSEKVAAGICKYRDKGGKFRKPDDFQKIWGLATEDFRRLLPFIKMESAEPNYPERKFASRQQEQFAFDPNTATEQDFQRLGLPKWTIKSILNYRSKGGKFRRKTDFEKIFNLSEADYARLEPYLTIAAGNDPTARVYPERTSKWAEKKPVDINSADIEAWMNLPGIGEKRARQMINYREKLGGFLSIDQVGLLYNLPDSVFQAIKPLLLLESRNIRKLDLNTATAAELAAHPYFSQKQADLIVNYRTQHGPYRSVDEMDKIIAFSDKAWLAKVKAYLVAL